MTTTIARSLPRPLISGSSVGLALALLSAASFSTAGSFARALTEAGWSPAAAVAARISAAAVMLAIPGIVAMRGRWGSLRGGGVTVVLYGLVGVAGGQECFFVGVALLWV